MSWDLTFHVSAFSPSNLKGKRAEVVNSRFRTGLLLGGRGRMKLANKIKISVFCKPEDNEALIKEKFLSLFPFDLTEEKIYLKQSKAKGFTNRIIRVFGVELEKNRHINLFLKNLNDKLNQSQKELLLRQANSRLDEQLNFFIRLDKKKLLGGGYYITDSGECFHIKISIAAFPAKKEKAAEVIREIFS